MHFLRQDDGQATQCRDLELQDLQEDGGGWGVDGFVCGIFSSLLDLTRRFDRMGWGEGAGTFRMLRNEADGWGFLQDTGGCGYEEYDSEIEGDCGGVRDDGE